MGRNLYLDASALFKMVVEEHESWMLSDTLRGETLFTSDLSRVELRRAILQAGFGSGPMSLAVRVLEPIELLRLDDAILDRAGEVGVPALRTLDAIHLASALSLGRELDALVTYDRRLAVAAQEAGLPVESPA
jgi:predicted nucleic acid-binding protein